MSSLLDCRREKPEVRAATATRGWVGVVGVWGGGGVKGRVMK